MSHFVYIVRCSDGTLYTGYTTDAVKRVDRHNAGRGAKYTRARRPVVLVFVWQCPTQKEAMAMEREIKRQSRAYKLSLCKLYQPTTT